MASVTLIRDSVLYCQAGWLFAGALDGSINLLGIDRHGRPTFESVMAKQTRHSSRITYVGTASAFGAFSPDSRILQSNGISRTAGQIVETGDIADLTFESYAPAAERVQTNAIIDMLWQELASVAASYNGSSLFVRCREHPSIMARAWQGVAIHDSGRHSYCTIDRDRFALDLEANWSECVDELVRGWCYVAEADRIELERQLVGTVAWLLTARCVESKAYSLAYDSLQHSAYVMVTSAAPSGARIMRGKTAFFVPSEAKTMQLHWADASWHPIASGFLLGSA